MRNLSLVRRRPWALFVGLLVLVLGVGGTVFGTVEHRSGQEVAVAADEVVADDLYLTGDSLRVRGTVLGDLVAVGREVVVEGEVEGDLLAAGQMVRIAGTVGDDARVAGQVLHLDSGARIGDDLVAAGFSLEAEAGSSLGGEAIVFGYQALLEGEVTEGLRGAMAALELGGSVGGDVEVEVGPAEDRAPPMFWPTPAPIPSVRPGLTLAEGARIGGDLRYESPDAARIADGSEVMGGVSHREVTEPGDEEPSPLTRSLDLLRDLVTLLLLGGLLLLVAPGWARELAEKVRTRPLPGLGWGLVFFAVALVIVGVIAVTTALLAGVAGAATLGGLAIAVVGTGIVAEITFVVGFLIVCAYLVPVVVALAGGRLVLVPGPEPSRTRDFGALVLGALVLVLLELIPFLGGLIGLLVLLLGLGSLWLWGLDRTGRT